MSDIVERLRNQSILDVWHPMMLEAAAEILRLRAENEKLRAATTPICVGRRIIGILAKEGAWTSETGASVVAADELFRNDPYEVIEKLRAALKPFLIEHWPEHKVYGYKMVFVTPDDLRAARALLEGKDD